MFFVILDISQATKSCVHYSKWKQLKKKAKGFLDAGDQPFGEKRNSGELVYCWEIIVILFLKEVELELKCQGTRVMRKGQKAKFRLLLLAEETNNNNKKFMNH